MLIIFQVQEKITSQHTKRNKQILQVKTKSGHFKHTAFCWVSGGYKFSPIEIRSTSFYMVYASIIKNLDFF